MKHVCNTLTYWQSTLWLPPIHFMKSAFFYLILFLLCLFFGFFLFFVVVMVNNNFQVFTGLIAHRYIFQTPHLGNLKNKCLHYWLTSCYIFRAAAFILREFKHINISQPRDLKAGVWSRVFSWITKSFSCMYTFLSKLTNFKDWCKDQLLFGIVKKTIWQILPY